MKKITLAIILTISAVSTIYAGSFESLITEGDKYFTAGDYGQAEKIFSRAIETDPLNPKGWWYRGDAYFFMKLYDKAEKDLTRSIELDPANDRVWRQRGNCYYNRGMYSDAEKDYSKAIELNPGNSEYWLFRGDCYKNLNMKEKAISDYAKAESLGNTDARGLRVALAGSADETQKPATIIIDPFTGAIARLNILTIKSLEIVPKEGIGYITGNDFPLDYPVVIKLNNPGNFTQDSEGKVYPGAGFGIYDSAGTELGKADDLYSSSTAGFPAAYMDTLSMTISLSEPLEKGKTYTLKVWFFDKKGAGRIDIVMKMRVAHEASRSSSIRTTRSKLGSGIITSAVNASVESITIADGNSVAAWNELVPGKSYSLVFNGVKDFKAASYISYFVDENGQPLNEQSGKLSGEGTITCPVSTAGLTKKSYYLYVRIDGKEKGTVYCIVIPVRVDGQVMTCIGSFRFIVSIGKPFRINAASGYLNTHDRKF